MASTFPWAAVHQAVGVALYVLKLSHVPVQVIDPADTVELKKLVGEILDGLSRPTP